MIPEIREAAQRVAQRLDSRTAPDYAAVNRHHPSQRAALTRAINSGNPEQVQRAVLKAVREWGAAPYNGFWPDDWSRWQRALDDSLPWGQRVELDDLR